MAFNADGAKMRPEEVIGARVSLKTALNETFEGEIFTYDALSGYVVLQKDTDIEAKKDYVFVKSQLIIEVQWLAAPAEGTSLVLPPVDLKKAKEREAKAFAAAEKSALQIGVGVSTEAQQLFNALSKTMPVEWFQGKSMWVMESVRIDPPYVAESCFIPPNGSEGSLARVRKVLDGERRRLLSAPSSAS